MKKRTKKIKKNSSCFASYFLLNKLFLSYVIITFIACLLLKQFTVGKFWDVRSFITELGMIIIFGSFVYLFKPKKQYAYLMSLIVFTTALLVISSIYYSFYASFASFGEIASLSQVETVTGSIFEKLRFVDVIYICMPFIFRYIYIRLNSTSYFDFIAKIENGTKMFIGTILVGLALIGARFAFATKNDYSSLQKQWNRSSVVQRFGIILYQCNDVVQTLTPRISSLFGYEDAVEVFKNFYSKYPREETTNKYTGILEGMNIVFVHMEGQQTLLMDQEFNEGELTPNLNNLAKEGTFFKNFYPQISSGTSSDTEFTLLSSLMPASSGTIFVSYYNRNYLTIPKLLANKGYNTFSMHGNAAVMWNRNKAHVSLGYQDMYFKEHFTFDPEEDVINLGINDKKFFEQAIPILENIESTYENYMGTIITLSNHSPFTFVDKYGEFDLTKKMTVVDPETNEEIEVESNYLEGTPVGNYFHSAHYADEALGEFINYIKESDAFENTIFVFYGDHDVKLGKNNINLLYNYDPLKDEVIKEGEEGYTPFDLFDYELSKNTPLIIWTKNKRIQSKLPSEVDTVTGMYDVMPTIGNMIGISNEYALGHDILNDLDDNIVVFPNGNFLTNKIYYNNSTGEYKTLKDGIVLDEDYINNYVEYTDELLNASNSIVVYDLLSEEHMKDIKGSENEE